MNKLLTLIFFGITVVAFGQMTERRTTVNGQLVSIHLVQKGETVYGLSRTYNVPASELMTLNPKSKDGLNIGDEFYIPIKGKMPVVGKKHVVKAGETMFAISQQYNITIDDIKKANSLATESLNVGQELIIPSAGVAQTTQQTGTPTTPANSIPASESYTVLKGETLFAISRKTGVSVDRIMEWNGLKDGNINEGQVLRIKPASSTPITTVTPVKEDTAKKLPDETQQVTQNSNDKGNKEVKDPVIETPTTVTSGADPFVEVQERGVAELIPDSDNTRKYLALHRTVKPGTVIRVRNEINNREVWARVIGPLPDTSENTDVLIKISKAAYDRLGALDKKFRVTITYIP